LRLARQIFRQTDPGTERAEAAHHIQASAFGSGSAVFAHDALLEGMDWRSGYRVHCLRDIRRVGADDTATSELGSPDSRRVDAASGDNKQAKTGYGKESVSCSTAL
jgi:hypothetical protein